MIKSIKKVLIANRGEIACRIIKTLKKMGIESIAIYSNADREALHVELADHAVCVGPAPAIESYLNIDTIINVAKQYGADAIHPGYGFLSENPLFAEACASNDIRFIGPTPSAIRAMGSKSAAKRIMEKSGVPLIPGYHGDDQNDNHLRNQSIEIGFPVILKAALGGGGKGMRVVQQLSEFDSALASCRREAMSSFKDDHILIEKYIGQPRHVEIQVFCDQHGNAVHLFERDCSIQRRHQKIVEEAPAPNIPEEIRTNMAHAAIQAAKAIDYVGAGTVEFLYDGIDQYYFMEMNTRLQVEHPVTEMITGEDLVEWQILVAEGKPLPKTQQEIIQKGHSIEVRLCAEDCNNNFMPSIGQITLAKLPQQNSTIRLDHGLKTSDDISIYYDPMFAKLIVWGADRTAAIRKLNMALNEMCIAGVHTNAQYLATIIASPRFENAELSTHFLSDNALSLTPPDEFARTQAAIGFSIFEILSHAENAKCSNHPASTGWRLNASPADTSKLTINTTDIVVMTTFHGNHFTAKTDADSFEIQAQKSGNMLTLAGDINCKIFIASQKDHYQIFLDGQRFDVKKAKADIADSAALGSDKHSSPMPGIITKLYVKEGQTIAKGDPLLVVEAMKMEHVIHANKEGTISGILKNVGDSIATDVNLVEIS